ncbi:hypothetical protein QQX98_002111 [Neonectria punicea]|uniref:SRR1-like domain-containing protein n=1 Tax=Neonectria punicea TaxID=979145 RepID=A0ABR1HKK3_9HYPO
MSQQPPDQAWTQVTSKRRRAAPKPVPAAVPPRAADLRPASALAADHARLRARWEDEEPCSRGLRALVAANTGPGVVISRAINLGVGTFDPVDGAWEAKRSSQVQLIAFLVVVEELGSSAPALLVWYHDADGVIAEKITGSKIDCIFQDPIFTQPDKDFLAGLGHRVVEDPEACDMVNADSLLFGIHLYRPVYAEALEKSLPAIFVGTGWDVWDHIGHTDGLGKMETMEKTYKKCAFPQDSHGSAFSSTSIYWKPVPKAAAEAPGPEPKDSSEVEDDMSRKLESTSIS